MSEQAELTPVVSIQDRLGRINNQLTSTRILIDRAQSELLGIRTELAIQEEKDGQS